MVLRTVVARPPSSPVASPAASGAERALAPAPPPAAAAPSAGGNAANSFYSLNRQAGTLTVSGTERQQEAIRRFLKAITANASAQVLIEAKIVEVTLNNTYQTGINWAKFGL